MLLAVLLCGFGVTFLYIWGAGLRVGPRPWSREPASGFILAGSATRKKAIRKTEDDVAANSG